MEKISPIILDSESLSFYQREGFLVVENLLPKDEVDAFLAHQASRASKHDRGLRSHTVDPQWKYVGKHPNVAGVAAQLLGGDPRIVQTMYLPKKGGGEAPGIALHQDTHYLPTEPNTLMACWLAMNDTGAENGGLCVVPGSHLQGLRSTHLASEDEHTSWRQEYSMRDREGKEWKREFYSFEIDGLEPRSIRKLEVPAGGGAFFTGMTIHGSFANRSPDRDRLAFAVHYVRSGTWVFRTDVQETVAVDE